MKRCDPSSRRIKKKKEKKSHLREKRMICAAKQTMKDLLKSIASVEFFISSNQQIEQKKGNKRP